jgi:hypothetical protein
LVEIEYEILSANWYELEVVEFHEDPPFRRYNKQELAQFVFAILRIALELGIDLKWEGFRDDKKFKLFRLYGLL